MTRIGIVGVGFMGMIHYLSYQKIPGAKVVALCEQDPVRLAGDWRSIKGNFGPAGTQMDLSGVAQYQQVAQLLADPNVDLVDCCLPPSAHADVTVAALRAGKHVFCEKPISLTAADAQRMVAAAQSTGKLLFIGHVLPFFNEYDYARKALASGQYGRFLGGHFKRITADPLWLKDFYDPQRVGGPMIDLHIHDAHFIRLVAGMPRAVFSSGRMRGEVAEFFTSQFLFDDPDLIITATSGAIRQQGRSFTAGYEIHLEQATLLCDSAVVGGKPEMNMPLSLLTADGKVTRPDLGSSDPVDAFVRELSHAVQCVESGQPSEVLGSQLACDALVLCERQTQSVRSRQLVKV